MKQWVNLTKDAVFVGTKDIDEEGRLGEVAFGAQAQLPDPLAYKTHIVVEQETSYSPREQKNLRFKTSGAKGTRLQAGTGTQPNGLISLPAAGGNRYKVEGSTPAANAKSDELVTWRRLYFQSISMTGVPRGSFVDGVVAEFEKHFISLKEESPGEEITHADCLVGDEASPALSRFVDDLDKAYKINKFRPFAFTVVWVEQLAGSADETLGWDLLHPEAEYQPMLGMAVVPTRRWLWHDLDASSKVSKPWFVKVQLYWEDLSTGEDVAGPLLTEHDVELLGPPNPDPSGFRRVRLENLDRVPAPAGMRLRWVYCTFRVVDSFDCGWAPKALNVIVVARSAVWGRRKYSEAERKRAFIHELGHKLGMVPKGDANALDRPAFQYTKRTHNGSHCGAGLVYKKPAWGDRREWLGQPQCVMFGSNAAGGETHPKTRNSAPATFCSSCEPLLVKLDLGNNMPGFAATISTAP